MDPLQKLWDLVEEMPQLQEPASPTVDTPGDESLDHPVIRQRTEIDQYRLQGMSPEQAYQQVHGAVDLSDTIHKRGMSSTFGRVQDDGSKGAVRIDTSVDQPSILAQDMMANDEYAQTSVDDLRTRTPKEVPDQLQVPMQAPEMGLQQQEEFDYNFDVAYLQKYGRA